MLSTNKAKFGETMSVYYRTEQYSEDYYLIVCSKDSHRVMVPVRSNTFIMPPYDVTIEIFKR